ncbi:hypothetical protein CBR_g883 [Chara braunii]|uniref:Uncharacterized protein n=1 Tax=Chara braunii TaxID=69332 RepID=A0A388KCL9_CHABU|nr:hypothetical protein CBR_g883 [Chara braunii]|eukprot:GBG67757.1 hypothetical protein CBR_g883 [Chara braunii]
MPIWGITFLAGPHYLYIVEDEQQTMLELEEEKQSSWKLGTMVGGREGKAGEGGRENGGGGGGGGRQAEGWEDGQGCGDENEKNEQPEVEVKEMSLEDGNRISR